MINRAERWSKMSLHAASRRRHNGMVKKTWSVRGGGAFNPGVVNHKANVTRERMQAENEPHGEGKRIGRRTN